FVGEHTSINEHAKAIEHSWNACDEEQCPDEGPSTPTEPDQRVGENPPDQQSAHYRRRGEHQPESRRHLGEPPREEVAVPVRRGADVEGDTTPGDPQILTLRGGDAGLLEKNQRLL